MTNDIQRLKRRAALWLDAWLGLLKHGRKKKEEIEEFEEEIKREKPAWGDACLCSRMHTGVCVCVRVCVCV